MSMIHYILTTIFIFLGTTVVTSKTSVENDGQPQPKNGAPNQDQPQTNATTTNINNKPNTNFLNVGSNMQNFADEVLKIVDKKNLDELIDKLMKYDNYLKYTVKLIFGDHCFDSNVEDLFDIIYNKKTGQKITRITFGNKFNQSLDNVKFPNSVEFLQFGTFVRSKINCTNTIQSYLGVAVTQQNGSNFNQSLDKIVFPNSLRNLDLGGEFNNNNKSLENIIFPSSLKYLNLGCKFNQSLDNVIFSDSLKELILGAEFNQPLEKVKFPNNLEILKFIGFEHYSDCKFNQSLMNVKFPNSLKRLYLGDEYVTENSSFNQSLEDVVFPTQLEYLDLGGVFDMPLMNVTFPNTLKEIYKGGLSIPSNKWKTYNVSVISRYSTFFSNSIITLSRLVLSTIYNSLPAFQQ